jgi:hypothetical protein
MLPEPDHEQDDGRARQAVDQFTERFDASYRLLAQHAALPLVLTPELLNYLRNKFLRGQVPWVAEVDLLLSDLCQPAGYEQYTMDPAVRAVLLRQLREDPSLGPARMQEVASLLIHYVRHLSRTHAYMDERELDAQQWAAMVVLDDQRDAAVRQIAAAFRDCVAPAPPGAPVDRPLVDRAEMARLSRITQALAPELQAHRDLVAYATDVGRLLADSTGAEATRLYEEGRLHQTTPVLDVDLPPLDVFVREVTGRAVPIVTRDLDLELCDYVVGYDVETFRVRVAGSPAGEQTHADADEVTIPPDLRKRLRLLEARELNLPQMVALGEDLAGLLFPSQARSFLFQCQGMLAPDERLRIRLRMEAHALADLPWEYAYIAPPGAPSDRKGLEGFLALDRRVSLVRYEALEQAPPSLEPVGTGPLRLVAFLASPDATGYPPLDLDAGRRIIEQALDGIPGVSPEFYPDATIESLQDALAREAHVFHFAGHARFEGDPGTAEGSQAGQGFLVLQDEGGRPFMLPADELAMNLRESGVRLVVLGAGEAGRRDQVSAWTGVALSLIRAGIPAVVGMQYPIRETSATAFYQGFYRALAAGQPVDAAVTAGRLAILNRSSEDDRDWGVPVLYMRSPDDVLFRTEERVAEGREKPPVEAPPRPSPSWASSVEHLFIQRAPVTRSQFFGRAEEVRAILSRVARGQSVSVVGPRRIGKTSLLMHVSDPTTRAGYELVDEPVFVYVDCHLIGESGTDSDVYRMLLERAIKATPEGDDTTAHGSRESDSFESLRSHLRRASRSGVRTVLLLDEFEVLAHNRRLDAPFFDALRSLQKSDVTYVTASTETLYDLLPQARDFSGSPFFNIFHTLRLGLLQPEEARALVVGLAERASIQFSEDDLAFLQRVAGPHPLYLRMAAYRLFEEKVASDSSAAPDYDRVRHRFDQDVWPGFEDAWHRLGDDEREALGLIAEGLVDKVPPEHRKRLEHECLVYQDAIFSSSFAGFVQRQLG